MGNLSHWSTIEPFIKKANEAGWIHSNLLSWIHGEDTTRAAAYDMYEAIFWTAPQAFQIALHGQETEPIYIPSGRKIVETAHRYLAPSMKILTDPGFGTPEQQTQAMQFFTDFARRERFFSKFSSAKFTGLIRGDWMFHIFADPARLPGSRVSIFPIHPGNYFPEYADGEDVTSVVAVHIVEPTLDADGKPAVFKFSYRKESNAGGPSPISYEFIQCPQDKWGQPGTDMLLEVTQVLVPLTTLPSPIDSIPVYHIPNVYDPSFGWGSSEMRGIERLMSAINQGITDEEAALVLEGIGVYTTDAGAPIDEESGEDVPWSIAPGRVLELPTGKSFGRVSGISSFDPYQQHLGYLQSSIDSVMGENDITRGQADVSVAESGIALALRMGPLLSRMSEKELIITDVVTQMMFDLGKWFSAYEGMNFDAIRFVPVYGEKIPINKNQRFSDIMAMYTAVPPIISSTLARAMLTELGYAFPDDATLTAEIAREHATFAAAQADAVASRMSQEIGNLGASQ